VDSAANRINDRHRQQAARKPDKMANRTILATITEPSPFTMPNDTLVGIVPFSKILCAVCAKFVEQRPLEYLTTLNARMMIPRSLNNIAQAKRSIDQQVKKIVNTSLLNNLYFISIN